MLARLPGMRGGSAAAGGIGRAVESEIVIMAASACYRSVAFLGVAQW